MKGLVKVPVVGRRELFWYAGKGESGSARSLVRVNMLDDADFVASKIHITDANGAPLEDSDVEIKLSKNNRSLMLLSGLTSAMGFGNRLSFASVLGLPGKLYFERKNSVLIDLVLRTGVFATTPYVSFEGYKIYPGEGDDIPTELLAPQAHPFYLGQNVTTLAVGANTVDILAQVEGDYIAKVLQVSKDNGTFELPADTLITIRDNNGKDWMNIPIPLFMVANKRTAATSAFNPFAYPRLVKGFNQVQVDLIISAASGVQTGASVFFHGVKNLRVGSGI